MTDMAEDAPRSAEEVRAQIDAARRKLADGGGAPRSTKDRRKAEQKQRKGRVNTALLRGQADSRDETWTIRARSSQVRAIKALAEDMSEPGSKVSIAALMDEAIDLILAKYRGGGGADA